MNVTDTPEITYGEIVSIGMRGGRARLITVLGEEFLQQSDGIYSTCGNCDGGYSGFKSAYAGLYGGECFQCFGSGRGKKVGDDPQDAVRRAKQRISSRKSRARRAEREAAAEAAAGIAWRAANTDLVDLLDAIYAEMAELRDRAHAMTGTEEDFTQLRDAEAAWGNFILEMVNQVAIGRPLTENQAAAVTTAIAKQLDAQAAEQARKAVQHYYGTPGDKVVVTGTVARALNVERENRWSGQTEVKRLVIVEGTGEFANATFKIWGVGASLWETEKGDVVEVKATIKDHEEYEGTKQTVLTRAKITPAK